MYKIDKSSNSLKRLEQMSFSSEKFRERDHLQEWIVKQPDVLGEDFLIIQKEFAGFDDTQERLDLLALDKHGSLVIIENKLDDSGKDVTWQALKYASYCSGLSKANITKIYQQYLGEAKPGARAEERISDFMDGQDFDEIELNKGVSQRIVLVAAKFRKEVTSAVLWLLNYKIRLQCFRATLFAKNDELFLNVEQIIPTQNAEDYMIGFAEKAQEESQTALKNIVYREFWKQLLQVMNAQSQRFQNVSPNEKNCIGAGSGVGSVRFEFVVSKTKCYGRAQLYLDLPEPSENKFIFDELFAQQKQIEDKFGGELEWERLDKIKACRIKIEKTGDVFNRDQWEKMTDFMTNAMCRLEKAIEAPLLEAGKKLKESATEE